MTVIAFIFSIIWGVIAAWSILMLFGVVRNADSRLYLSYRAYCVPFVRIFVWPTLAVDWFTHNWINVVIDIYVVIVFYRGGGGGGGGHRRRVKDFAKKFTQPAPQAT